MHTAFSVAPQELAGLCSKASNIPLFRQAPPTGGVLGFLGGIRMPVRSTLFTPTLSLPETERDRALREVPQETDHSPKQSSIRRQASAAITH